MKALKRHLNRLRQKRSNTARHINEMFTNEEWSAHAEQQNKPSATASEKMYAVILQKVSHLAAREQTRSVVKFRLYAAGKYAAAAAVLLMIGTGIWFSQPPEVKKSNHQIPATAKTAQPAPVTWSQVANTSKDIQVVHLPDLSVVTLYPKSTLTYERGLPRKLRDVYLYGKALFKVKKNRQRPFSVYAGGLKTTALGTSFTINTKAGWKRTSVMLHTGKIVVVPNLKSSKQPPVYLSKAESGLMFDTEKQLATRMKEVPVKIVPEVSLARTGSTIKMKNIPLKEVLGLLEEAYQVKVTAESKDIRNITYTGEVDLAKENIENVLQVICLINNMALVKNAEQEFTIKKVNK